MTKANCVRCRTSHAQNSAKHSFKQVGSAKLRELCSFDCGSKSQPNSSGWQAAAMIQDAHTPTARTSLEQPVALARK